MLPMMLKRTDLSTAGLKVLQTGICYFLIQYLSRAAEVLLVHRKMRFLIIQNYIEQIAHLIN